MKDNEIKRKAEELIKKSHFVLRPDVKKLIDAAFTKERGRRPRAALGWIRENAKIAKRQGIALCQDTGLPMVFIEVGKGFKLGKDLIDKIKEGIAGNYRKYSLRKSVVDPLKRGKPGFENIVSHVSFSPSFSGLKVTLFPKGFGSENKSCLRMFEPAAGPEEIEAFVLESIKNAGSQSCPPFFVGIGIGGTADYALSLAKLALTDRLDLLNRDKQLQKMEKRLLKKINKLRIGPMGFGGSFTALAVKIKKHPTHIAGLPVGINISCHALRSATVKFK